jgi:UDP-N-acetylglucosamine enolpyruvyl transferase
MPSETPPPEPEEAEPTDEAWLKLRESVAAAIEIGRTDAAELTELINSAKNEDLRAAVINAERFPALMTDVQTFLEELNKLVGGRELVAERQYKAEIAILDRIQELSKEAPAEDLHMLTETYAQLRHYSVAPGWYAPDVRHSEHEALSGDEDVE